MFTYTVTQLTASTAHIADPTGVACFLVQGQYNALLIDTGTGLGRLDKEISRLTSLPLSVILTHGHCDHTGGASLFDRVYLNDSDRALMLHHNVLATRMEYAGMMLPQETLTVKDFVPDAKIVTLPLENGQLFDLGGITVQAIAVPGHTKGTMCLLIKEERSILFGDACNINTLLIGENACTVQEYLGSLQLLTTYKDAYDTVYYSHGPAIGSRECLADNIELCHRILTDTDDRVPFSFMGQPALRAAAADEDFRRLDGKFGNIVYSKNSF